MRRTRRPEDGVLSVLQEKLAEAHGLAIAATTITYKVEERVAEFGLRRELVHMRRDAEETRRRCLEVEEVFGEELAGEMLAHANTTDDHAADLVAAWFKAGTGPISAWTFLAMGEAAEVATWRALAALAEQAGPDAAAVRELAAWALPVQGRHLQVAVEGAGLLGASADAGAPRWG